MATSINSLSGGTRPRFPRAKQTFIGTQTIIHVAYLVYVHSLRGNSCIWRFMKVQVPPKVHQPSPESTIFIPIDLITLAINHIGVDALMVVTS
jgi:hypothetical protein